jgi:glycosyltransferase involved in cell wall biosynthesis
MKVAFVSVLPSPYQRDFFAAVAARADVTPRVFYMERAAPDSPWPERPLAAYESYLPGFWFSIGHARVHVNWRLPSPRDYDVIVCNTLMSLTGQWLLRAKLRRSRWMFWGEKLGARSRRHDLLTAPLHRAAGIAAIGSWAERDYAERFPKTRIFNIPYHCDLAPFAATPRPPRDPGAVTFFFCGQMIARKGVDHLLAAFATLPEMHACCSWAARRNCRRCSPRSPHRCARACDTRASRLQRRCRRSSHRPMSSCSPADTTAGVSS